MQPATVIKPADLDFRYLPAYVRFILDQQYDAFIKEQIRLLRKYDLPLLELFAHLSEKDFLEYVMKSSRQTLELLAANEASRQISESYLKWPGNEQPSISRDDIGVEDIYKILHVRKLAFIKFLPAFSSDPEEWLNIIKEIDELNLHSQVSITESYISILQQKIQEHTLLLEKINNTSPGILYVLDMRTLKTIYSNDKLKDILGYTSEDLAAMGGSILQNLLHPDDLAAARQQMKQLLHVKEGEILTWHFRAKDKTGGYRWVQNLNSAFKRDPDGTVTEIIGIALDVDAEKRTADELKNSREQLLEAQELADMGSFEWDFDNHEVSVTPQLMTILELNETGKMKEFMEHIHPSDRAKVEEAVKKAINETGVYESEYRLTGKQKEKVIWSRGIIVNKGEKRVMRGSIMDVTDRHHMIQRLQRSEEMYKQAQALTHIGNYVWDLATNKIQWSDELYRIYGLEPQSIEPDFERVFTFNHPDDSQTVTTIISQAIEEQKGFDFVYRIILPDQTRKYLHARGEILVDNVTGKAYKVIGTTQDITQRQLLMEKLQQGEVIYKQAESLAKIGNWKWNLLTDEVEWTDELYRIYGLEPQSEKVTLERFKSFIHPDYRDQVAQSVQNAFVNKTQDYTFKIVTEAGEVKTIRSIAQMMVNENGEPVSAFGTEQDVTENEDLIARLQESEKLFKQAARLANMGNWTWDLGKNKIEWTEELYKIYEIATDTPVDYSLFEKFTHPEDLEFVNESVKAAFDSKKLDYRFRIVLPGGRVKIIHSRADVMTNINGEPVLFVGTAQDITEHQSLVERLQQSEMLYKQSQSLAHIGNWSWDVTDNRVVWSDELYRIFGLEPAGDIDYEKYISLLYPDDVKLVTGFVDSALKEKKPYEFFHRVQWKDGSIRILHSKGAPLFDAEGKVYKLLGTAQDVTEQKHIEEELRDSKNFIQKIANATPSIIASYNINTGKYKFISEGLEKLLGYDPDIPLKQGVAFFVELIHPDDLQPMMEENAKAIELANSEEGKEKELIVEFQYRMKHCDGEYRWFHTYGTIFDRNGEGKVEHVLNISLDISERKTAEQKIKEQEYFIQHIADASPTILYLYNVQEERIEYINQEIAFVTGFTPEEIIDMNASFRPEMYHPEDLSKLPEKNDGYHDLVKDEDSMFQYECRMRSKHNKEWRWLLVREIIFSRDENNNPLQVVGAAIDISERREMEQTLQRKNMELEQSNTSLEEFAYVASHDLQEPLRKISVFSDKLLGEKKKLDSDQQLYLKKIIDSSLRMQNLIDDLLIISRISHDKSFSEYDLQSILNETLQLLEHKIESSRAAVTATQLPVATIIPSQFRQLFQNLLNNSLKFVSPGLPPEIKIDWQYLTPKEVSAYNVASAKRYIRISFSDNGIGFENEYASKIFVIFQRLHGVSEYEGTGIGLAICKKIIENHGGLIYATSEPGKGATFTIIFPG